MNKDASIQHPTIRERRVSASLMPLLYLNIAMSSIRNNGSDFELLVFGLFI